MQQFKNNPPDIRGIPLEELREADAMIGSHDLHEGYRKLMQNRINDIESARDRSHQSKVRALGYLMRTLIGLVLLAAGVLLERFVLSGG